MANTSPQEIGSIDDIYSASALPRMEKRYAALKEQFKNEFGHPCEFIARAPGRVNLIGEHVDYSGYGVLPMAIDQDCCILVAKASPESKKDGKSLHISNSQSSSFATNSVSNSDHKVLIDKSKHEWTNYFLAGYKGVLEDLKHEEPVAFEALVDGIVPKGSGLSSSSALVCASALSTLRIANGKRTKKELADLCAHAEHYVGTEGGGMDQAISFLGKKGKATMINFNPLTPTDVTLPQKAAFVIANSLVQANKYVSASTCFNMRVVECRLSALLLALYLKQDWRKVKRLIDVQKAVNATLEEMAKFVDQHLHRSFYTTREVSLLLGISEKELIEQYLGQVSAQSKFLLHDRAYHVFSEADRVSKFASVTSSKVAQDSKLEKLGNLMNESHESCSKLYDCSCPELDQLTTICRAAGAFGSRLTGAGWGGCTVSLVSSDNVEKFMLEVKQKYYIDVLKMKEEEITNDVLFSSQPGSGACYVIVEKQ